MEEDKVYAVVPFKQAEQVKQRLRPILNSAQRYQLAIAMLKDVLGALSQSEKMISILVVSRDSRLKNLVESYGARLLSVNLDNCLNSALSQATLLLQSQNARQIMYIHADIPLLASPDLDEVISDHLNYNCDLTLVPSNKDDGTNIMLRKLPSCQPLRYGKNSYRIHLEDATSQGLRTHSICNPRIGFDIDTPKDFYRFLQKGMNSHTHTSVCLKSIMDNERMYHAV